MSEHDGILIGRLHASEVSDALMSTAGAGAASPSEESERRVMRGKNMVMGRYVEVRKRVRAGREEGRGRWAKAGRWAMGGKQVGVRLDPF